VRRPRISIAGRIVVSLDDEVGEMKKIVVSLEIAAVIAAVVFGAIWYFNPSAVYGLYGFLVTFAAAGVIDVVRSQINPPRKEIIGALKNIFVGDEIREGIRIDNLYNTYLAVEKSIRALETGELGGKKITSLNDLYDSDPLKAELQKLVIALQRLLKVFEGLEKRKRIAHTDSAITPMIFTGDAQQVARSVRVLDFQRNRVIRMFRSIN
jgi:hypothetical protein